MHLTSAPVGPNTNVIAFCGTNQTPNPESESLTTTSPESLVVEYLFVEPGGIASACSASDTDMPIFNFS